MPRVKTGYTRRRRHKKILKLAKGYFGKKSKAFRIANQQVMKSLAYAYEHRKKRKGEFRRLWISRINAAARLNGISYSRFMNGLKQAGVKINRKMLADLAVHDAEAFKKLADIAKEQLSAANK
ncbi:MAG: 50S ribosomal protein L20 [Clostridia bacterium 41_269]|nr:MAG: 50S ribosomal protein L20 [Clostridia bacterium 41_269]